MQNSPNTSEPRPEKNYAPTFLVFMFVYLCIVHAWGLPCYPLGRDWAAMAEPGRLDGWLPWLFQQEMRFFGTWLPAYHAFNFALLYGIMVAVFFYARHTIQGPWWLGSLAAVLLMANPVKTEAVLNLAGIQELIPALLGLGALACYAAHVRVPRTGVYIAALLLFANAVLPFQANIGLGLVFLLHEALIPPRSQRRWGRSVPFLLLAGVSLALHPGAFAHLATNPGALLPPLHFVLYPIGLLPGTALFYHAHPGLEWAAIATEIAVLAWLAWILRRTAFPCGLLAALVSGWTWCARPIDPVHLSGGGQLLLPAAFCALAFAACCRQVIKKKKWHMPLVLMTSLLCVLFFALQLREIAAWRYAGDQVRDFQAQAAAARTQAPRQPLAIVPDYQYYRTAPMRLCESIAWDTPFSKHIPARPGYSLHFAAGLRVKDMGVVHAGRQFQVAGNSPGLLGALDSLLHVFPIDDERRAPRMLEKGDGSFFHILYVPKAESPETIVIPFEKSRTP